MAELKPGWQRVKFGDVVRLNKETCKNPEAEGIERVIGLEHLEPGDLRIRSWGDVADGTTFTNRVRPGQVLFGKRRAYQRKVAVSDFDAICSGDIYVFETVDQTQLLQELLPYICQTDSFFDYAIGTSAGSLSPRTNWKSLRGYDFALPPLEEQQRISIILKKTACARESFAEALARLEAQKMSLLNNHFELATRAAGSIFEYADIRSGGTPSRSSPHFWQGDIPWLSPKDMKKDVLRDTSERITMDAVSRGSAVAPAGTVFIVVRGMILQHTFPVCEAATLMAFNQDIRAVVPRSGVESRYLALWFRWAAPRFLRLVSESSHGTKRLELSSLGKVPFSSATAALQAEFIGKFELLTSASNSILERIRHLAAVEQLLIRGVLL